MASRLLNSVCVCALTVVSGAVQWTGAAETDSYAEHWGPPVGSRIPVLEATDQTGAQRNLENLAGQHGLLLFMVRSADW